MAVGAAIAAVVATIGAGVSASDSARKQRHLIQDQQRDAAALQAKQDAVPVPDSLAIDAARRRDRIRRAPTTGRTSTVLSETLGG